jgi:hypothetical protein
MLTLMKRSSRIECRRLSFVAMSVLGLLFNAAAAEPARWWKGNTHTHSLWSDGDDYPEMIVEWYTKHGYNFLGLSDHNIVQEVERWSVIKTNKGGKAAFDKYQARFGSPWVETRVEGTNTMVRLKKLSEYRKLSEAPGKFLLIPSEELTDRYKTSPVHMNVTNIRELIKPQGGDSVLEVIQKNVDAVNAQRERTGQAMLVHLNHPNFGWGVTAEELMQVRGDRFFEVYNGHHQVHNDGDAIHAGTERVWDIVLSQRLAKLNLEVMYGVGTDDSHNYHKTGTNLSNTGRGWIMVRAQRLEPEEIVKAMDAGDFYASSGVTLRDVRREKDRLVVEVQSEPGVKYTIQFFGTRTGFDDKSEPVRAANGEALRVTHRYSNDIGALLAETEGTSATYKLKGDEIYVRARVVSTKVKSNPAHDGELEKAWTQPLLGKAK